MKVYRPSLAKGLSMKKRQRHSPEQIVKKLRDADAMLAAGKSVGEVLQSLEISEATLSRWRAQFGGMKSEEAKRLKQLEEENNRLKKIIGDQALDIQMLREIAKGN
jgi:putative transposase